MRHPPASKTGKPKKKLLTLNHLVAKKSKMIPMEEFQTFLSYGQAQAYLSVVFLAICFSLRRYYKCGRPSNLPPLLSVSILFITWFYIFRFILTHISTSQSYFDDAYRDVLKDEGQHMISVQLLTWAIVSVIWMEDEGTVSDLVFLGYGFLGAMGASFVLWIPSLYQRHDRSRLKDRRTISLFCVVCACLAFVCVANLSPCTKEDQILCDNDERFGSFRPSFRFYLHSLHYVLVIPAIGKLIPPLQTLRVDAAVVYFIAAIILSHWHFSLLISSRQSGLAFFLTQSMTDCQKSISTDMLCCSLITLYAIYKDSVMYAEAGWLGLKVDKSGAKIAALFRTSVAAICIPVFSPAGILAFHLFLRNAWATHLTLISRMQKWVARNLGLNKFDKIGNHFSEGPSWCNLGLWEDGKKELNGYDQACERLALALANVAGLNSNDAVLCTGCGSGPELELYKSKFNLRHITGIDPCNDIAEWEKRRLLSSDCDYNIRRMKASVEDLRPLSSDRLFRPGLFNKILALDNVYHYQSKQTYFRDCKDLLPSGGKIAVTDILINQSTTPMWVQLLLLGMGIPSQNLWTRDVYMEQLSKLGYIDIEIQSTKGKVLSGWDFLPHGLIKCIDYAIITATVPKASNGKKPRNTKIAVVGSGLAGLATAKTLLENAPKDTDISVSIFEAADKPGLAGNSHWHEDYLIDIPPRMASRGYYFEYRKMLKSLGISTQVVEADCTYYGNEQNSKDSNIYAFFDNRSTLANMFFALFTGGLKNFWKVGVAMSRIGQEENPGLTFGDWMEKNSFYSKATTGSPINAMEICRNNPYLFLIVGSLGWMLSCTYQQLFQYPADIILPYLQSMYRSSLTLTGTGQVVRVNPSIKILENTLLYGVEKLTCGMPVSGMDKNKIINGVKYDAVVCATEARGVTKVMKHSPAVFSKVKYHPSEIYLHTDESFMPTNKKDWRRWTVEMTDKTDEPQLTFWLNKVYPDTNFSVNTFETWAPSHPPRPETVIKRAVFQRVVHTPSTRDLLAEIEAEQGKNGVYFAGSYTIHGMGLLEQALISGRKAANQVLVDLYDNQVPTNK